MQLAHRLLGRLLQVLQCVGKKEFGSCSDIYPGGLTIAVAGPAKVKPFQPYSEITTELARRPFIYQVDPPDNGIVSQSSLPLDAHDLLSMCS